MALIPLTTAQQVAVDALISAGRLIAVPADLVRAQAFLQKSAIRQADIPNASHSENRFDLAYSAAHDVGEALLAAYGYRIGSGQGHHETLGRFVLIVLDQPPGSVAAAKIDGLRRTRNAQNYRAQPVGTAAATLAASVAADLYDAASSRGVPT